MMPFKSKILPFESKTLPLKQTELKFVNDNNTTFSGYASVFGGVDSYDDTILPGAFKQALIAVNNTVKMYYNHSHYYRRGELPIGKMELTEDTRGLKVIKAEFTPQLERANQVAAALKHGTVDGLSIGFKLRDGDFYYKEGGTGRVIKKVGELMEVSVVDFPSDHAARIIEVRHTINQASSLKQIEMTLRDTGLFSRKDACALVSRIKTIARGDHGQPSKPPALVNDIRQIFNSYLN